MNYRLKFLPTALKEWERLDHGMKCQFKKKLAERLERPEIPASRLRGFPNHYKIKLKTAGFRLVYEVQRRERYLLVIAVGKRERNDAYHRARRRST